MIFQPEDRVKTKETEVVDRIDGKGEVVIPAGHGGTVVVTETGYLRASAQVRWPVSQVTVTLDSIDGVNYTLKTSPGFFTLEQTGENRDLRE